MIAFNLNSEHLKDKMMSETLSIGTNNHSINTITNKLSFSSTQLITDFGPNRATSSVIKHTLQASNIKEEQ